MLLLPLQGRVTISNDGATIMKLLDIVHPAAKVLADISMSQDAEVSAQLCSFVHVLHGSALLSACCGAHQVGDGTTTVVILAGELLKECKAFLEEGVHPQARFQHAACCAVPPGSFWGCRTCMHAHCCAQS